MARGMRLWGFDDEEREVLLLALANNPALAAVVARAEERADTGVWIVQSAL